MFICFGNLKTLPVRVLLATALALLCACGEDTGALSDSAQPASEVAGAVENGVAQAAPAQRYAREFPAIGYAANSPTDAVAQLATRLGGAGYSMQAHPQRGYLDAALEVLGIDAASQILVFSRTSQQVDGITAATPRAIYFNDDVYVAWVPGASNLEFASVDAQLGAVFYTLAQSERVIERRFELCLSCHDSYSLTGGGVPRMITGSGYIGTDGNIVTHEGWILTNDRTPLRSRWGGWYVSGMHGEQVHLGNIAVESVYELEDLESLRNGNYENLQTLLDVSPYLTDKSDIVALLVFEHQTTVQNAIIRLNWDYRQALPASYDIEPLVAALLMAGTPVLTDAVAGTAGFEAQFLARSRRDAAGRSLRDFDLQTRLFRYPLSYVIHSPAFAALPDSLKVEVLTRLRAELLGESPQLENVPGDADARRAAWEILLEVQPAYAALVAAR